MQRLLGLISAHRKLIGIGIAAVIGQAADSVLNLSAIPPYAAAVGWTARLGLIYAVYLIAEAAARSPMGTVMDRIGGRLIYSLACIIGAVMAISWTFVHSFWLILIIRAVSGAVFASIYITTIVAMGAAVREEHRTMSMNFFFVTLAAGLALGPAMGGYINDLTHFRLASFYLSSGIFLIAAVLGSRLIPASLHEEYQLEHEQDKEQATSLLSSIWLGFRSVPDLMLLAVAIFLPVGVIMPVVKLFAMDEMHLSETGYGLVFVVGAAVIGAVSFGGGKIAGLWGKGRAVQIGLGLSTIGMFGIALIRQDWAVLGFGGATALGYIITVPVWFALVSDLASPKVRGSVIGAVGLGQGIGTIAGAALGGYLYQAKPVQLLALQMPSHYTPFLVSAAALAVSFILAILFVREHKGRRIG